MHSMIYKTLGGLSPQYYFRQFFFGLVVAAFVFFMSIQGSRPVSLGMLFFSVASTLFYPYSRFVYERVMGFIIGNNIFFVNACFMLIFKFITMVICWAFALFVAPIGLAYLYYHHSKAAQEGQFKR